MTRDTLDIAVNLSEARTPPPEFYRSQGWYDRLREAVLTRSWSLLPGPKPGPGLTPTSLLPGSLDEPLVWTRDEADALALLSNVCTHRNAVMIDEACVAKHVACPYHGRRFGLDGQVSSVPGFPDPEANARELLNGFRGHWSVESKNHNAARVLASMKMLAIFLCWTGAHAPLNDRERSLPEFNRSCALNGIDRALNWMKRKHNPLAR